MKKAVKKVKKGKTPAKNEISELRKLAYIFGSIVLVFIVFYGIAYLKMNDSKKDNDDIITYIQYEKILVNNILNQNRDDYYVLIYDEEEEYNNYYYPYVQSYSQKDNSLFTYIIDINDTFNSSYKNETSNLRVSNISDIKIKGDTLLKISNAQIVETYEGGDAIVAYLKQL